METLLDIIDSSAQRYPARPALLIKPGFRTRKWTYADLADLVPRVAAVLADSGITKGDRVIIWAVNRPEWGIAFFGALHAGAVLVPLDFRTLPDFAQRVAERTRASYVLASPQTLEGARTIGLPIHTIESLPDLARGKTPLPRAAIGSDDLVEVVFTSGTTGDPKGAMLTNRNILSNAHSVLQFFPVKKEERLLSILPLSHMFEQTPGFIVPLLAGASIVYPVSRQPAVLARTFREFKASMLLTVPYVLRLLNNGVERRVEQSGKRETFEKLHRLARRLPMPLRRFLFLPVHRQFGGRLHTIGVGGAALDVDVGARWEEMGVHVLQGYGSTECGPVLTFNPPGRNRLGTVGLAVPGTEVRLTGDGEVLARGPNVFPGYWENPEATAAALVDGWYRTGDLGEMDRDGYLTLRGRKKDMLALPDGTKVYPEDVEKVLAEDARLKDATVVGLERPGEQLHVHAVLLLDDPSRAEAIVRDASARLGSHQQIRGHSVWPDADFPRTHTLKVKKREVIARLLSDEAAVPRAEVAQSTVPLGDVERLIAQVANVSGDAIRKTSRLSTDLNLDSLQRVELLGVIEEELGVFIDDAALDPDTTVAQLEELIAKRREERRETGIFAWPLHPLVRAIGLFIQEVLMGPLVWLFYKVKVTGREHLEGLRGPVMFAPNHHLHWDNAIILNAIPLGWRWRLTVAAAADDIFGNALRGLGAALIANAFPLARQGAIRRSLELLGARLDREFSVLIYPEGKLTVGGPMQPFLSGAGLIAVEGGTPVVPMKLKVKRMSLVDRVGSTNHISAEQKRAIADRTGWGLRGDVEVVFGRPIVFAAETDFNAATKQIESAVRAL